MEIKSKWGLTPIKSGTFWIPVIIIALSIWVFIHNQSLWAIAGILFMIPVYDVINGYLGSPRIVIANEGITLLNLFAGNRRLAWTEIVSWDIENDKTEPHIPAVRINIKEGSILLRMQFYRNPEQLTQGIDLGYKTRHSRRKADMQNFNPYHIEPIKGKEQENIGKEQFEIVSRKLRNIPWNGDAGVFIGTGLFCLSIVAGIIGHITNPWFYVLLFPFVLNDAYVVLYKCNIFGISDHYLMCRKQFGRKKADYYRLSDIFYATIVRSGKRNHKLYLVLNDYSLRQYFVSNLSAKETVQIEQLLLARGIRMINNDNRRFDVV